MQKICTIGGGSGMPVVNQALVEAGIGRVYSIVTTFDSGGDTGRLRTDERGNLLAFSDYWRALMSLWKDGEQKQKWEQMLKFRDSRGRNFGNSFFVALREKVGDINKVASAFVDMVGANVGGEVIPVCLSPSDICFETISGAVYKGEHRLDELRMSQDMVKNIWLEPEVEANAKALKVLEESDLIIICPGSMHGSILVNFLTKGFAMAFCKSKAKKILMTNIMSTRNENHGFDQDKYTKIFEKYLGKKNIFDLVLMPDLGKLDKNKLKMVYKNYELEYSYPIKMKKGTKTCCQLADMAVIDEKNLRLRHGVEKLAKWFKLG